MPASTRPSSDDARSFLRPGLWAGLAAAAGAAVGLSASAPGFVEYSLAALFAAVTLGLALTSRLPLALRRAAMPLSFVAVGLVAGLLADRPARSPELDRAAKADVPVHFTGTLDAPVSRHLAPPEWESDAPQPRATLIVSIDRVEQEGRWTPTHGRALLGAEDRPFGVADGDDVEGLARLAVPEGPRNPGEDDSRPRLARASIAYTGALVRGSLAAVRADHGFSRRAERFRETYTAFVKQRLGPGDRAALVAALAVGERGDVSQDLSNDFNVSGLAHVLSISGLHLAVAILFLAWILRRLFGLLPFVNERIAPVRLAAIVALPVTWFYVLLIGAPPSAVRAGIGMTLLLIGRAAGRSSEALSTLGWSLAVVAIADPASLYEVSTQLSFFGVLGLACLTPRLRELLPIAKPAPGWRGKLQEGVLMLALGSLGASLATVPLTAFYFERASIVSAAANVVAWPASTVIVPAGASSAVLFAFSPALAGPLVDLAGVCAAGLAAAAKLFGSWPAAAVHVAPPSMLGMAAYAAVVVGLSNLRRWPKRASLSLATLGGTALVLLSIPGPRATGKLEVTFLAVGQGDSTVLRFPHGQTMVVDAGGEVSMRFDPGARIVTPFLRSIGTRRIDWLVATHPHPDHIGGMPSLFDRFPVGELWYDGLEPDRGPQAKLLATARAAGTRVLEFPQGLATACPGLPPLADVEPAVARLSVGDPRCRPPPVTRDIDGVHLEILHPLGPPPHGALPELSPNNNSLVLRLTYGNIHVLLPGDLEKDGEAMLLASGRDVSADLLKAPHHGSSTSSTDAFIRAVHPHDVVFCVGEHNRFGFPRPEVVDRYARAGCRRFRTDEGAVTFSIDGRSVEAHPFAFRDSNTRGKLQDSGPETLQ